MHLVLIFWVVMAFSNSSSCPVFFNFFTRLFTAFSHHFSSCPFCSPFFQPRSLFTIGGVKGSIDIFSKSTTALNIFLFRGLQVSMLLKTWSMDLLNGQIKNNRKVCLCPLESLCRIMRDVQPLMPVESEQHTHEIRRDAALSGPAPPPPLYFRALDFRDFKNKT